MTARKCIAALAGLILYCQAGAVSLTDQQAGEEFFHQLQRQLPLVDDPLVNDYISYLGNRLVAYSNDPNNAFHFFVIQSGIVNAFSGPGGYIGVFGGLILTTENESELAGVLAHEISHVTQDHLNRGSDKMKNLTLPAIGAMVAAIATGNPALAASTITGVAGGVSQYQINNTRIYEEEADNIGIQILAKAGFNPYGMPTFFEKLQEQARYDTQPPPFLLDHPVTQQRIAQAHTRAEQLTTQKTYLLSDMYVFIKARISYLLASDPRDFLQRSQSLYDKNAHDLYTQYLLALAYLKNHQYSEANALLKTLNNHYPQQLVIPYTQAQVAFAQKDYQQAIKLLKPLYELGDDYYPIIDFYALCLLRANENAAALNVLEPYQTRFANEPNYWLLLSKAYANNKDFIYAYISRAKAYLALGDVKNAIVQLQMAQQQPQQTEYTKALTQAEIKRLTATVKPN